MNLRIIKPRQKYLIRLLALLSICALSVFYFTKIEHRVIFNYYVATFLVCFIYEIVQFDLHFTTPKKWNDLTDWQIEKIGHFIFTNENKKTESEFFKNVLVCVLFIPKPTFRNIIKFTLLLWRASFRDLQEHTAFVFDQKQYLTRFPKKIKVGRWPFRKVVFGPADRLANITIKELSYADTFFYKWITEEKDINLHQLAAILYRPTGKSKTAIDLRIPFSSLLLEQNAKITEKIPLHIKFMIAYAYEGCRENFISRHRNVFPRIKVNPENPEKAEIKKPRAYQPFSKIIESMAMDDVQIFGSHQEVENVLAPTFLAVYDESIVRQRELERQRELQTRKIK